MRGCVTSLLHSSSEPTNVNAIKSSGNLSVNPCFPHEPFLSQRISCQYPPACVCQAKVYNPPPEAKHETLLFFTSACVPARERTLGRRRSFSREMEAEHGEKQVHRRANQNRGPRRQQIQMDFGQRDQHLYGRRFRSADPVRKDRSHHSRRCQQLEDGDQKGWQGSQCP